MVKNLLYTTSADYCNFFNKTYFGCKFFWCITVLKSYNIKNITQVYCLFDTRLVCLTFVIHPTNQSLLSKHLATIEYKVDVMNDEFNCVCVVLGFISDCYYC